MNGIKRKFQSDEVLELLASCDIVTISESHLNVLNKCPKDFLLIARSKPVKSLSPRGGIAVYKKITSEFDAELVSDEFRDCVIFRILPIEVTCIAMYISPSNTKYYTPEYMENLQLFLSTFKLLPTCLVGDLNARFGQPPIFNQDISYKNNPDKELNVNARLYASSTKRNRSTFLMVFGKGHWTLIQITHSFGAIYIHKTMSH